MFGWIFTVYLWIGIILLGLLGLIGLVLIEWGKRIMTRSKNKTSLKKLLDLTKENDGALTKEVYSRPQLHKKRYYTNFFVKIDTLFIYTEEQLDHLIDKLSEEDNVVEEEDTTRSYEL